MRTVKSFDLCTKLHIYMLNTGVDLEVENCITKTELPFPISDRMIVFMFFIEFLSSTSLFHMKENATQSELTDTNAVLYNDPVNREICCCMAL